MIQVDLAIIGTGPGGYVAALRAAQLGAKVVCIEKDAVGGVCLNWGCIPTKALLRCAEVYTLARDAAEFGVLVDEPGLDWSKMQARKKKVTNRLVRGVGTLLKKAGIQVLKGEASFVKSNTLSVTTEDGVETVVAENIIIATGSRNAQVPIPGLDSEGVIDSTGALQLEELPESICVIGGGAIGLEFASLFNTLGVQVTVVEMLPSLAPLMDASIGEALGRAMKRQGISVHVNTRVMAVVPNAEGLEIKMQTPDGEASVQAALVLSAIGRSPNVEGLGLEKLGINPTRKGIQVDDRMRTAVPHVYAIGDVALDGPMLAHVASHQGVVAVEDALGHTAHMEYTAIPACIFTTPEVASVGLTEAQAREAGYDVQTGTFPMAANGKAIAHGETEGFVKMVSETKHQAVLGVHIVGPHASDLILEGTLAMSLEATLEEIERTVHAHPTLGECNAEAALDALGRALHIPGR